MVVRITTRRPSTFLAPSLHHASTPTPALTSTPPTRALHSKTKARSLPVPAPTAFVPNASTFLTLIGRSMAQHASKFQSWSQLFTLSSPQLKGLGIEPARQRRYLLWWRDRFRRGQFGIGGDLTRVSAAGQAELRVVTDAATGRKVVVNTELSEGATVENLAEELDLVRAGLTTVAQVKVRGVGRGAIVGSYVDPVKGSLGSVGRIKVQEGIWEVKRGVKLFGGERRRKNVLSRIAARARGTLT